MQKTQKTPQRQFVFCYALFLTKSKTPTQKTPTPRLKRPNKKD